MDWYILAIIALFCYGAMYFLYKVSAEKKCNTAWTTFSFMITVMTLSGIAFFIFKEQVINLRFLLIIALLNAVTFLVTTLTRIESLKYIPTSISFPIIKLSTVIVVLFSLIYFKDTLSIFQIIGIIIAIAVIFVLTREDHEKPKNFRLGLTLAFIALIASSTSIIIQKFAAVAVNALAYIAISYAYNTVFSFGLRKQFQGKKENPDHTNAIIIGFFIGVFNFAGFYIILKAYSLGPLSIIASITSLSFVIPIILSFLIYKEKLTSRRIIGIILSIIAVLLLGL